MATVALDQNMFIVSVPSMDTKKFKQFIKLMGWKAEATPARTRLYDPESGKYLNDKTMQAIEDANAGRNIAFRGTVDEFKAWADAL